MENEIDGFTKHDNKKIRLELVESDFILGVGEVLTFGANKYSANNWKDGSDTANRDRIMGALLRHIMAYKGGEKLDNETGISHLYHASCNLMFLSHFDNGGGNVKSI